MTQYSIYGQTSSVEWLTLLFIALKLLGEITWSWWWVLSPLWIVSGIVFIAYLIKGFREGYNDKELKEIPTKTLLQNILKDLNKRRH